jgi:hypothetical protein
MLRRTIQTVIIAFMLTFAHNANAEDGSLTEHGGSPRPQVEAGQVAQSLFDGIVSWIVANFDLPGTPTRPVIEFATKAKLRQIRIADRANWQGFVHEQAPTENERNVVAVYDRSSSTIYLPETWTGETIGDQSILVHEMVHHLQNLAGIKFECPAAKEKMAYLAQDKWLAQFAKSLEKEFDVDMFTVVISSACM